MEEEPFKFKDHFEDEPNQIIELKIEETSDMDIPSVEPEFLEIQDCTLMSMSEDTDSSDSDQNSPEKSTKSRRRCCACRKRKHLMPFPNKKTDYLRYLIWQTRLKVRQPKNRYACVNHFALKDIIRTSSTGK
jgi:hypothetical protein